jgi:serine/threonine protein kinase
LLEAGQIFAGRYRIRRRLAEGGMAAIFEAEHLGTERRVALKLLFPHIMSVASAREKFELEAKVAARVNSPHIVQVLDAGFDETSKSPYLVMELLQGDTLGGIVKARGLLPPREVVSFLRQVAAGLDAAHGYRDPSGAPMPIVHRDLKPENIFVTSERDGVSLVKILDFGIAKVLSDTGNVSQEVRGTPLYMAFEQVTASRLSPATDIWALGLIAYHALTGQRSWRSASTEGAGVQSLFAEILTLPLEPPSVRMQQQGLTSSFGEAFDAWLLECIDRDPARRFASAGSAVEALARALAQPVSIPPRAAWPRPAAALTRTEALPGASPAPVQVATAPSLSAMASERSPSPPHAALLPRNRIAAAAGAGALLLVLGVYWLSSGDSGGSGTSAASDPPAAVRQALEPPPAPPSAPSPPAPAQPAESPQQPPARTPVIAPIVAQAPASRDAGAPRDSKGDYPVPSWPPPALPGEEASEGRASTDGPERRAKAAPAVVAPAAQPTPVNAPAEPADKKAKPPAKPASKPKFNPYDMR